ncbi:MAG: ABC transporter ATP-binding protein [Myxococcales bacterium]|nr:MAG: ABC transporter ATP-binding protein [Myxococcales bacterium]
MKGVGAFAFEHAPSPRGLPIAAISSAQADHAFMACLRVSKTFSHFSSFIMSSEQRHFDDHDILERYTDQPRTLPERVRRLVRGDLVSYALSDLNETLRFAQTWLVLSNAELLVATKESRPDRVARAQLGKVELSSGLSCHVLRVYRKGSEQAAPLVELRFTHRQRRGMEGLAFLLEQAAAGQPLTARDADVAYVDAVAQPIREAQALVSTRRLAVVWRLLSYLAPYKNRVFVGMGAATLVTLLALVPPFLTGHLVDRVIRPVQSGELRATDVVHVAWLAVLGIAVVHAVSKVCVWLRLPLLAVLGELVAQDLRNELFSHLQKLSVGFYMRKKTGSLITRVSADTDRLWEFLAFGVVEVTLSLVSLLGLSSVLIYLDWRLGLVMAVPVPLMCLAIHLHGSGMNRLFTRAFRKWSRLTDVLSDTIPGMRVVKAFNQESREETRFTARNADVVGEFNRIHAAWTGFWPALMLALEVTVLCVWVLALPRLLGTGHAFGPSLSLGKFVSFLLYTTMFVYPVEIMGQVARIMHRATSSAHRVFEVLDTQPEVVDDPNPVRFETLRGEVELERATFAYDGVRQVIKGISFKVKPGELIGLVGPSGGGKTTLINLLTRFYDVTGGRVLVDGVDVRKLEGGRYREQVGIVLQEPYLFHGSVLENIRYGVPEATFSEVIAAARVANAHDFISRLPHGYDTVVGERGHSLSGGERQRVSIARAVLKNPRILILDEATSSVDTETERKIQEAMDRLVAGRTVFAIAHRLSTLRKADRLFVIQDGLLAEQGTHAELLANPSGIYTKLHRLQQQLHEAA